MRTHILTEAKEFRSREKSSVQGVQLEFFESLDGVQLGVSGGYNWRFLGASRQRVLLDVFRSLKGRPVEIFLSFKGAVGSLGGGLGGFIGASRGCAARGFPQIKHATGRIVCVSCKYVGLWYRVI